MYYEIYKCSQRVGSKSIFELINSYFSGCTFHILVCKSPISEFEEFNFIAISSCYNFSEARDPQQRVLSRS